MKRYLVSACAVIAAFAASGLTIAQDNPFVGTWKLNVEKSKYDPGPSPKRQTRSWESSGVVTVEGIDAMGKPRTFGYTIRTDGKEYPATGATNGADSVSAKAIDANTLRATFKRGGTPFEVANFSISNNGKVLTISSAGTNANGQRFKNVQVWEKQQK